MIPPPLTKKVTLDLASVAKCTAFQAQTEGATNQNHTFYISNIEPQLAARSHDELVEIIQRMQQYNSKISGELEDEKTKTEALSEANYRLLQDLNRTRQTVDLKDGEVLAIHKKNEALNAQLMAKSIELEEMTDADLYHSVKNCVLVSDRNTEYENFQKERQSLYDERADLRKRLRDAELTAYHKGTDVLQSKIDNLNRKLVGMESGYASLEHNLSCAQQVAIQAAKFAREQIQYFFGNQQEIPALDQSRATWEYENAVKQIKEARKRLEEMEMQQ